MTVLDHVTTLVATKIPYGRNITDLQLVETAQGPILVVAADGGTALSSFLVAEAGNAASAIGVQSVQAAGSYLAGARVEAVPKSGKFQLAVTGQQDGIHRGVWMDQAGMLTSSGPLFDRSTIPGDTVTLKRITIGEQDFILAGRNGDEMLSLYSRGDNGELKRLDTEPGIATQITDAEFTHIETAQIGSSDFAIASSPRGGAVDIFRVKTDGLSRVDGVDRDNDIGIAAPHDSAAVKSSAGYFLVVAGGESNSLTVFRMDASGRLDTRDHVIDSLHTRFQSATAVDGVEIDGRGFVFAGGADDGISVMTLDGQGRLILLATLADTANMTLADISALEAKVIGSKVAIFAASATENGVTQLVFDPGRIGITKSGSGRLTGGEDNDIIIGMGASSALAGAGGDDILIGREGEVAMHGGDGSDIFIPTYAAQQVTIHDYDPRCDTLDLSELAFIRSIAQLKIIPTAGGAALQAGTVRIEIQTSDGKALSASHFTDSMFPLAHYVNDIDYGSLVTPVIPISDPPGTPLSPGGGPGRYSGPTPLPPPPSRKNPVLGTGGDDRIRMPDRGGAADGLRGNDDLLGGHGQDLLIGNNGRDTLSGGKGSDEIYGGAADDLIKGGGHHDRLSGHGNNDTIYGGSGDDRIWGYVGKDVLHGETGNDVILGGPGADSIYGGDGDDLVYGEGGLDRIEGGSGHDRLIGIVGHNVINGGTGNDWIRVWGPGNRISGGDGDDSVTGGMEADHISLDTHDDVARGRMGDDTIFGADGQDRIYGNDGNDALRGEAGNDSLYGGIGDDTVLGEAGDDIVNGDGGHDSLRGGLGNDTMNGGLGPDRMWGELGRDDMLGGAGPDEVWGLNENDTVRGGLGNDTVVGGDGNDLVDGGFGNDIMSGDAGNDTLMGDHGNDTMDGGEGDDVLIGGERYDQLTGGAGADRFVFSAPRISSRPDVIEDFRSGEDVIDLTALPDDLVWTGSDGLSGAGRPEMALQDIQGGTQLLFDLNGDADPDFRISVMGSPVIPFDLLL